MPKEFVTQIKSSLEERGHTLLYLVKFGSHLYGTNTKSSDTDYKGVFLPSKDSCLLCTAPKQFSRTTGNDDSKNTKEDIDVQVLSLQHWLYKIRSGEINSIDLLYSFTHRKMIEYFRPEMRRVFSNHTKFFNRQVFLKKGFGYIRSMLRCGFNSPDEVRRRKSLSHAVRVCDEMNALLTEDKITFPIKQCSFVTQIKLEIDEDQVREWLQDNIEELQQRYEEEKDQYQDPDTEWISTVIKSFY